MEREDEIIEAVDAMVDDLDVVVEREARRLGIPTDDLLKRIANELQARA
jgi:hypothetical protein